jgi:hypothetical protein
VSIEAAYEDGDPKRPGWVAEVEDGAERWAEAQR